MADDFAFGDFTANPYPASSINTFEGSQQFQQLQPGHQGQGAVYGNHVAQQPQFPHNGQAVTSGDKRKESVSSPTRPIGGNFEEASRQAAEEDKRRRNTAASARFRIKKKQREQALEKSAKEMTDKVTSLENKVAQLETENKWLKNLLVEKNEGNDEISTLWKEFTKHAIEKNKNADKAKAER
jgi:signal recognition particle GTPase